MDEIIDGIERRQGEGLGRDGSYYVLDEMLKKAGLPSCMAGSNDPAIVQMHIDLFELLERRTDAEEAGKVVEAAFIGRQLDAAIERAKQIKTD